MLISSSQVLLEVDDVQFLRLARAECGICPNPPTPPPPPVYIFELG